MSYEWPYANAAQREDFATALGIATIVVAADLLKMTVFEIMDYIERLVRGISAAAHCSR